MDAERREQHIKDLMGDQALKVLGNAGIDVNHALSSIIGEQLEKEAKLKKEVAYPGADNTMTSELVYIFTETGLDSYREEHKRRLGSLGFSNNQIDDIFSYERETLAKRPDEGRKQPWVRRYFFMDGIRADQLPKPEELTLSELILITDDATAAYARDHHWLSPETWSAVCKAAIQAYSFGGAQYALAFKELVKSFGWSEAQERAYNRNECMLTERLKWGYHDKLAWTGETTDLSKYKP